MVKTICVSVSCDEVSKSKKDIRRGGHAWVVSDVMYGYGHLEIGIG